MVSDTLCDHRPSKRGDVEGSPGSNIKSGKSGTGVAAHETGANRPDEPDEFFAMIKELSQKVTKSINVEMEETKLGARRSPSTP
jgi:hypothetical protein